MSRTALTACCAVVALAGAAPHASADDRDVKIRSVNFETGVFELHNFGDTDVDLSAWRWCSADENQIQEYSGASGLNGVTIEAGASILFYFNDDAPSGGDANNINRSDMGGDWAEPLDATAYGMGIYFDDPGPPGISFGNGDQMADYLQWDIEGVGNVIADFRADEAVAGGLWGDVDDWISTADDTVQIVLKQEAEDAILNDSGDFDVLGPEPECPPDCNGDGGLNILDFVCFQGLFAAGDSGADCNGDGGLNILDFTCFQAAFAQGCP